MYERHGQTRNGQPRLYRIWRAMRFRCTNESHASYPRYGGRGITVCKEWQNSYQKFQLWAMEHGYQDALTLERKNNDGNYSPINCRWATPQEQMENTSRACLVEIGGIKKTVKQWSDHSGIVFSTLYQRYHKGVRGAALLVKPKPVRKGSNL